VFISLRRKTGMLSKEISEFGMLIADEDSYEKWQRRRWLEEEELALQEEEMLDRRERAQDIASVGKRYY
jgi:hypothetical protein